MKKALFLVTIITCFIIDRSDAANRFWVAGSASNWSTAANWSTTSGGAGGAGAPGNTDVAIFDAGGVGNAIINASINVQGIQVTAAYAGSIIQLSTFTITVGTGGYSQAAGTFVGSDSMIDINGGAFSLTGGTFISTTANLFIGGTQNTSLTLFTFSGGTFLANNGTVRFDPDFTPCGQSTATVSLTSSLSLNHLIIDVDDIGCTEDILAITGSSIIVAGNLTHFDGFFNAGTIQLTGNIFVDTGADGGAGVILVNGTTNQQFTYTGVGRTAHLNVNKSSGSLSAAPGTTDLRVQRFTLDAGIFNAPTGSFNVGGSWSGSPTLFAYNAGTFNHSNGTVRFDPDLTDCAQRTATMNTAAAITFYDMIVDVDDVSCNEDIFSVSGAGSVTVANNFTAFDGYVNGNTVAVRGNVFLDTGADGGNATILMNDPAANQTYNNTSTARFAHLRVNKAAGSVSAGVGTTNFLVQQFTLDAGTFNAPSGSFNIGGFWSGNPTLFVVNGGTFNHNNGTVQFDPDMTDCAQRTATLSTPTAVTFYNLIIDVDDVSCNEDIFSISGANSVIVENDFTQTDGYVNTGTVEVRGNVYLQAGADGGTATILMNHPSANQTYNNTSTARFAHLRVNKAAGSVSPGVGTTSFFVQQFTLDAGTFNAPTGSFNVGGFWAGSPTLFTLSGGTFNHNNGTVRFDPDMTDCAQRTATMNTPSTVTFYNLIIDVDDVSCNEDIFAVSGASSVIVENDFTQFDGYVNTGTVEVRGNVYLDAGADGGTATILMNHPSANQTFNNTSTARFAHLRVNKAAGSVSPGVGTTNFLVQQFTLDAGTFNAPTGSFNIGGFWAGSPTLFAVNGGTFNHNNGTVRFDPDMTDCAQRTATLSTPTAVTFYNLIIDVDDVSCNEDIFAVSGANSVIVANDFTQFDGYVNTGTVEVRGNVYLDAGADGGTATILMNHPSSNQTYNNTSTARFAHLRVNKAAGSVSPGVGTTNFLVQQFTLDAGTFNAPTGSFNVGGFWAGSPTLFVVNGGTFNHGNGTVRFDPDMTDCAQRTATLSTPTVVTFYNLIIDVDDVSCNEDIFAVSGANSVIVTNDFTQVDGYVNTGTVEVRGNVYLQAGADGGTATILMNHPSANQTYNNASTARFAHLRVNKAAGSVSPGVGTTSFLVQQFTLDAGTFNAPTGTFNVGGFWAGSPTLFVVNGGTFVHNNGTVRFDPDMTDCAQRTATLSTPTVVTFYNLIIDVDDVGCNEDIFAVSGASSVIVEHDFTQFDGFVNTGTIEVRGDVYLDVGADGGTATILMNHPSANQTYNNASTARFAHLRVNKGAGSVSPGVGTTTFLVQQFTLDAGTFNAPTGSFNVGGLWATNITLFDLNGGTFNHNNGTVRIDPDFTACGQNTATIDAASALTFNNLIIDVDDVGCTEDVLTITGSTTISILSDLTLFDGFFNTAVMQVQGNVTVASGFDGGNGSLVFTGGNAQNFTLTGATGNFNGNVTINKSSNSVTLLSQCLMDAAAQSLTLTSGLLNTTAANLLIIGDNVTTAGGSATSYVNGPMRKVGNDAFTFPTGKSGVFSTIRIAAPGVVSDAFTAEYFVANPTGAGYNIATRGPGVTDVSACDYWILDRTTGTSNVQVTLMWNKALPCYGFTSTFMLTVARWDGSQWSNAGMTGTTNGGTTGTVTSSTVSSFSPFAVASTSVALPIELVDFKATWIDSKVVLHWETASELDNDYFTVERLEPEIGFQALSTVSGMGTSKTGNKYSYTDEHPLPEQSYYRLKQTDFDGTFTYSPIVTVYNPFVESEFLVFPNPAPVGSTITFSKVAEVEIFNTLNQRVLKQTTDKLENSGLLPGVYILRTKDGTAVRLVIQ